MKLFSIRAMLLVGIFSLFGPLSLVFAGEAENLKEAQAFEQEAFDYIEAEGWC